MTTAIVVAHFHPQGLLRDDLAGLLRALAERACRIVFVSTRLASSERARLPAAAQVIVRDNTGYDFFSYKVGIEALGDRAACGRLVLMNSSFITVDVDKLLRGFFEARSPGDVFGLVYSREHRRHLSSFLLSFAPRCFNSPRFTDWWARMQPIDERERVIPAYELGLSSHLRHGGFALRRAYHATAREQWTALRRAWPTAKRTLVPLALNPMLFYWDFVLRDFGVAKVELVKKDPYGFLDQPTRGRLVAVCGAAGAA